MKRSGSGDAVVLVITPYLHHDGSSLLLFRFLRWAEEHCSNLAFDVLYRYDGPLRQQLLALSNVRDVKPLLPRKRRILHHIESRFQSREIAQRLTHANAIYCNTVVGMRCLEELVETLKIPRQKLPRISVHVRELGYWIQRSGVKPASFSSLANTIIADSSLTAKNLTSAFSLSNVCIIDEYCDTQEIPQWQGSDRLRQEYGIPSNRKVVGMSGTIEWRKGPDMFLLIAKRLAETMTINPPLFAWVGGGDANARYQIDSDIKRLGLESSVLFTGPKDNPYPYYSSFDLFLLSSREEPFGAVCLEAAMLDIPSLCFAGCAGAETFIADGAGLVVDHFDVSAMAEAVKEMLENGDRRRAAGEEAHRRCLAAHSHDVLLPRLLREVLGGELHASIRAT
jgi:glycosyltransferase involved in cell wall biosynthesis